MSVFQRNFPRYLGLIVLATLISSCGSKSDDKKDTEVVITERLAEPIENQTEASETSKTPNEPASENGLSNSPEVLSGFPGTYEQVENRQTKLRIDAGLLVITNILLPIPRGTQPARLTPKFPHQLTLEEGGKTYTTKGFYNDGESLFDNVTLKIRAHTDANFIDVTFVLPPSTNTIPAAPQRQQSQNSFEGLSFDHDCFEDFCCDPCCDPCFPTPPPPPPPPPCDSCCCDEAPKEGKSLLYRFEKLAETND